MLRYSYRHGRGARDKKLGAREASFAVHCLFSPLLARTSCSCAFHVTRLRVSWPQKTGASAAQLLLAKPQRDTRETKKYCKDFMLKIAYELILMCVHMAVCVIIL